MDVTGNSATNHDRIAATSDAWTAGAATWTVRHGLV
jgi:hypothetical protein